jgi:hypothetical protein
MQLEETTIFTADILGSQERESDSGGRGVQREREREMVPQKLQH